MTTSPQPLTTDEHLSALTQTVNRLRQCAMFNNEFALRDAEECLSFAASIECALRAASPAPAAVDREWLIELLGKHVSRYTQDITDSEFADAIIAASLTSAAVSGTETRATAAHCKCGQQHIPAGVDVISWYWQKHGRTECTLELPNKKCWCGLLRSEHIEGHRAGAVHPQADGVAPSPTAATPDTKVLQEATAAIERLKSPDNPSRNVERWAKSLADDIVIAGEAEYRAPVEPTAATPGQDALPDIISGIPRAVTQVGLSAYTRNYDGLNVHPLHRHKAMARALKVMDAFRAMDATPGHDAEVSETKTLFDFAADIDPAAYHPLNQDDKAKLGLHFANRRSHAVNTARNLMDLGYAKLRSRAAGEWEPIETGDGT